MMVFVPGRCYSGVSTTEGQPGVPWQPVEKRDWLRAEVPLVSRITQEQVTFREAIQAKLKALRAELGGPNTSP